MSIEKMREDFEAWTAYRCMPLLRQGAGYASERTGMAWSAWQASRAAIEVELPKVSHYFDQSEYPHTCAMLDRDLRASIESLGLKVKP